MLRCEEDAFSLIEGPGDGDEAEVVAELGVLVLSLTSCLSWSCLFALGWFIGEVVIRRGGGGAVDSRVLVSQS